MGDEIDIRRVRSIAEYQSCQDVQRRAWGIADESYVVPLATLVGAQHHGGLVLGAFLPNGNAVGVSFAFLGRVDGRLCLYSQLTGILPGRQSEGLGYRLKMAQREHALSEGITLIAWAFDPLQSGNARFNLEKLGATAHRYVDDMYGPRTDALNAGVPTDRLIAEWELSAASRAPTTLQDPDALPAVIRSVARPDGTREVARVVGPDGPKCLLEIPHDIAALRSGDRPLAGTWGSAVRAGLTRAFAAGYRATGFVRVRAPGGDRAFYVLERD